MSRWDKIGNELREGASQLGVELTQRQATQLVTYLQELEKWNRAYNLSAVRDPQQMVSRHLLDSLSILPQLQSMNIETAIDVGTGAGLPGIPLAIMMPDCHFTLLDSNGKKTRFLLHVGARLRLDNLKVEQARAENYTPKAGYPVVITRAFASLADMTRYCDHLLAPEGRYLAMKGAYPEDELMPLKATHKLVSARKLEVPHTEGERHLLTLKLAP